MKNQENNANNKAKNKKNNRFGNDLSFASREAYNLLETNVLFSFSDKSSGKIVGITSPNPQEGKSYIAINLAFAMANDDKKVILIDADMRKPTVASKLGLEETEGLSNMLVGTTYEEYIYKGKIHENIDVVRAGDIPPNPTKLLGSSRMQELLEIFKKQYDFIIVDLPPVNIVVDPITISKYIDGYLVVVRNNRTCKKDIIEAIRRIKVTGVDILGFVYNDYGKNLSTNPYYRRYYSYYYKRYGYSRKGSNKE